MAGRAGRPLKPRCIGRTWYLVRHGETEWNAASRMQGQSDSRLTPLGREQARTSGRLLAQLGVDAIFASPLGRVRETIAIIEEHVSLPVVFDDRLKEWSAGLWSGELYADLKTKWPVEWAQWVADRYHTRSPGGESFVDVAGRASAFVADAAVSGVRVAIVAHGFFNQALTGVLLGLSPVEVIRIRQTNDTVIRIVKDGNTASAGHFISGDGPLPDLPEAAPSSRQSA